MHCPLNYGAILQTYALQKYLESLELKVKVIDYRPEYIVCDQNLLYVGDERLDKLFLTRWAYRILKAPTKIKRINAFRLFSRNELNLTPTYYTYKELVNAKFEADMFFCGSDQIWNTISGSYKDPSYFLEFVPIGKKKISYAASGNLPISDEVINITFPMINRLDSISMREDSTIAAIQPYIGKKIAHVCDPVLLLDVEDWRSLYKRHSTFKTNKKYILVYPMGSGVEQTMNRAHQIAKQLKLPLYNISASQRRDYRVDKRFNVNPYDFLALVDQAECVVTNSFHGTVFSIIFSKNFWTCIAKGTNQRITSLLDKADLNDRLLDDDMQLDFSSASLPQVNACKFNKFINQSKIFINNSIYE